MTPTTAGVARALRNWQGEDHADRRPPEAVAAEIDALYQEYLRTLPEQTARIVAGQAARERMVG